MLNLPAIILPENAATLLILLVAGHVFADFATQTARVAERKERETVVLIEHGLMTLATHLLLVLPLLNVRIAAGLLVLSAAHIAQDALRSRLPGDMGRTLIAFLADQAAHLFLVAVLWLVLTLSSEPFRVLTPSLGAWLPFWTRGAVVVAGGIFNIRGGYTIVLKMLSEFTDVFGGPGRRVRATGRCLRTTVVSRTRKGALSSLNLSAAGQAEVSRTLSMGRTVGYLERLLVYVLVLNGQWAALGLVVAAKSIARFPELKNQDFSDYYLIGTLTSLLVAVASAMVVLRLV
jgi:hypothetical protein